MIHQIRNIVEEQLRPGQRILSRRESVDKSRPISVAKIVKHTAEKLEPFLSRDDMTQKEIAERAGVNIQTARKYGIRRRGTPGWVERQREIVGSIGRRLKGYKQNPEHIAKRTASAAETRRKGQEEGKRYGRPPKNKPGQ